MCKIVADSLMGKTRVTTFVLRYPTPLLYKLNTVKSLSRNTSSFRAIPTTKLIEYIKGDTFVPFDEDVTKWLELRDYVINQVLLILGNVNVHKETINRLLTPFSYSSVLATMTYDGFKDFLSQVNDPNLKPLQEKMFLLLETNIPNELNPDYYHIPFDTYKGTLEERFVNSVAISARISYRTNEIGKTYAENLELYNRLLNMKHMSPFEHIVQYASDEGYESNLKGVRQYRKIVELM